MASVKARSKRGALVLDSTAFYAGIPSTGISTYHTTPHVIREVSHNRVLKMAISALIESGKLIVTEPSHPLVDEVRLMASRSGDVIKLSDTDVSVVALGLQLKRDGYNVTIISDDYSIQNLVNFFELKFSPVMTRGISKTIRWFTYCSGCGKVFHKSDVTVCDVCGTKLKRKMRKRHS
ncbi:MAG: nucleotide-binding protein [archaeon]|nr:nucleotide-binding protein [archaeon]